MNAQGGGDVQHRVVVITGTSTDIGKTIVTAGLAAAYLASGMTVAAVKPAQTGIGPDEPGDLAVIAELAGVEEVLEPIRVPEPLAPDTAALRAGVTLPSIAETAAEVLGLAERFDVVLVEGAGGLLVRLDGDGATIADLAARLRDGGPAETVVQVVIVVAAGLGTLNHTELTVEALRVRGLEPSGLVIGSWPESPDLAARCNLDDLPRCGVPVIGSVPEGAGAFEAEKFRRCAVDWFVTLP